MKAAILVGVLASCPASAVDKFFGEGGGGAIAIGGAAGQHLENQGRANTPPQNAKPQTPPPAAPSAASGASPRIDTPSRKTSARPAPAERNVSVPEAAPEKKEKAKVSLWNGLVQPLEMNSAAAQNADPADARERSGQDYEALILGAERAPARPKLEKEASPAAPLSEQLKDAARDPKLFVSVEIDPVEAGTLRDAVAGLGSAAGFAADSRFGPLAAPGGKMLVSGWLPAKNLAEALKRPGIRRVQIETLPKPTVPSTLSGDFVLGLRVEDPRQAKDVVTSEVQSLNNDVSFKLSRVVGVETTKEGEHFAIIEGSLPLNNLSRVLSRSAIAKVSPLTAASHPAPAPPAPTFQGFGKYVMQNGLWLIVITLALALPTLRSIVRRATEIFVPYR